MTHGILGRIAFLLLSPLLPVVMSAQEIEPDSELERRIRAGEFLAEGWHPYLAAGPAMPLGRLGEIGSLGVSGHAGAWYIPSGGIWPGIGVEASYAGFARDTDESLPGRYQVSGVSVRLTSKGRQRLFFDWLGAYGSVGAGVFRHGSAGNTTRTSAGASLSAGMLLPIYGREGFIETRVQHLFSGETLGRGNGLTFAPLLIGVRF